MAEALVNELSRRRTRDSECALYYTKRLGDTGPNEGTLPYIHTYYTKWLGGGRRGQRARTWCRVGGISSVAMDARRMRGMVNGRMARASCHSHSAAMPSASARVGSSSGRRAGDTSGRLGDRDAREKEGYREGRRRRR